MTKKSLISFIFFLYILFSIVFPSFSRSGEKDPLRLTEREAELLGTIRVMDVKQAERAVVKLIATSQKGSSQTGAAIFLGRKSNWGYFLTAFHVVRFAGRGGVLQVIFRDLPGKTYSAEFVIGNESLDLAVIGIHYLPLEFISNELLSFETISADDLGELRRGKLGVTVYREITSAHVKRYNLRSKEGALVSQVAPGSVSNSAGLQSGDLIIALNGVKISGAIDFVNRIKRMPGKSYVVFDIDRRNISMQIKTNLGEAVDQPDSVVYSLGHPTDQEWNWQIGNILNSQDPNFLSISTSLSESGISGGPLMDKHYRLTGIVVRQGGTRDTALRIEKALEMVAQWRIPYKLWLTNEFCSYLKMVLNESKSNFDALKIGAGRPGIGGYYEWRWPSKIDLSGQNKTEIHKIGYGPYLFEATMAEEAYGDEADNLLREIAIAVKKCIPDSSLYLLERGSGIKYGEGLKVTYEPEGFWGSTQIIGVHKDRSNVTLRIHSR